MEHFFWRLNWPLQSGTAGEGSGGGGGGEASLTDGPDTVAVPPDDGGSGGQGGGEATGAGTPPLAPPVAPPAADWRDRRIDRLTAQKKELEAQLEAARAAGARVEPVASVTTAPTLSQADVERLVNIRAAELAQAEAFNRKCNEAAVAGRTAFGEAEFNSRVAALQQTVDRSDPAAAQAFNSFLDAAIDTGEGPRILHELGANLNEAARIMALPPHRMGVELARLAAGQGAQLSGAAKPPGTVVGGRSPSHDAIDPTDPDRADRLSTAEWMRRRERQLARA